MTLREVRSGLSQHRAWLSPLVVALVTAGCGGTTAEYPQSTLIPQGDFAAMVDDVFMTTVKWAVLVFVLVEGALLFAIWKFRSRPGDAEPEQSHGNTTLEILWTIIPAAILAFIAVPTVRTIFRTAEIPENALEVEVIGHQWWWEFRYPEQQIVTASDLVVPAGRTVLLKIRTADVLHSFWVPQFAAKRDAFPNKYNTLWFTTDSLGVFTGQCAEFCGTQHGRMHSYVVVKTPAGFDAWVANQRVGSPLINRGVVEAAPVETAAPPAPEDPLQAEGKELFISAGCVGCHAMVGQPTAGVLNLVGPNLSHLGSRTTIAGGILTNTDDNLARWLRDPQAVKPGSLMKLPRQLTEDEVTALVAYLRAHQ